MTDIEFHENIRPLVSFDIKNVYTNIPTVNLKDIISSMLDHNHIDNTHTHTHKKKKKKKESIVI
jgi:predicted nucleotidyltransferase